MARKCMMNLRGGFAAVCTVFARSNLMALSCQLRRVMPLNRRATPLRALPDPTISSYDNFRRRPAVAQLQERIQ